MKGLFYDVSDRILQDVHFAIRIHTELAWNLPKIYGPTGFARSFLRDEPGPRRLERWIFHGPEFATWDSDTFGIELIELQSIIPPSSYPGQWQFSFLDKFEPSTVPWMSMGISRKGGEVTEQKSPPPSVWRVATHGKLPTGVCKEDFKKPFEMLGLYWIYGNLNIKGVSDDAMCKMRNGNTHTKSRRLPINVQLQKSRGVVRPEILLSPRDALLL